MLEYPPPRPATGVTPMKCPHCLALCADSDTVCINCRQPLARRVGASAGESNSAGRMPVPQRVALITLLIGYAFAEALIPADFPSKSQGGINFGRALCIGGVCAFFGPIGFAIGSLFTRRQSESS